jgi:hypothetical protein
VQCLCQSQSIGAKFGPGIGIFTCDDRGEGPCDACMTGGKRRASVKDNVLIVGRLCPVAASMVESTARALSIASAANSRLAQALIVSDTSPDIGGARHSHRRCKPTFDAVFQALRSPQAHGIGALRIGHH